MKLKQCCDQLELFGLKIAFIESASSGYLTSQFSIYKHSGTNILLGGLVSYDPLIKDKILNIDQNLISTYTAESAEVTQAMAQQGQILFQEADLIVSCTGLLKPGGSATPEKPEGTFFITILYGQKNLNFKYFIKGEPLNRLNLLTEYVATEILKLINLNQK